MSRDETIPVILSACRTPIGKYLGGLSPLPAPKLGALVIREAVRRAGIAHGAVEEVIMGNVLQGGVGQAPGRQAAIHAGLPGTVPALASHQKAVAAMEACRFKAETVPVEIPGKNGPTPIEKDESPRKDSSLEALAALKPSFEKDGTVTPGNAPGLNDGASALVVTSLAFARAHGLAPLARITAYATGGGEPKDLFFAPIVAVRNLMAKAKTQIADYELIEANEAFAVQALAAGRALGWGRDRVNVNGGAIALGHPIGASGARVLTTLLYALKDRHRTTGLATLCLGGGNAVALSVEML